MRMMPSEWGLMPDDSQLDSPPYNQNYSPFGTSTMPRL